MDIDNPPALPDGIPEKDEDIPDGRKMVDEVLAKFGGREKVKGQLMRSIQAEMPKKKVGPNAPAPVAAVRNTRNAVEEGEHAIWQTHFILTVFRSD